jgi:hypothetical protein
MLNRGLLVIKAKEPFRQWLLSLPDPDDFTIEEINDDSTAYLVPEFYDDKQRDKVLSKFCKIIFEEQLEGWWEDEKDWPVKRDLRTFKQWFDYEFHSLVVDLDDTELIDEE